jgi:uncharacterized protein (TIGR03643 family)
MKGLKFAQLQEEEINRIIEMAWEDRTPFEAIEYQFGLKQHDVMVLMRHHQHPKNWKKWRAHTTNRPTKHLKLRGFVLGQHKCKEQRQITLNRISKKR